MTLSVLAPIIARALTKLSADMGEPIPPVPAMPAAAPVTGTPAPAVPQSAGVSTSPTIPPIKDVVQQQVTKIKPQGAPSAEVPDAAGSFRNEFFGQRKFDRAALLKSPAYQRLLSTRVGEQANMTPEQYAQVAEQDAIDYQRTARPARLAGFYMKQHENGMIDADQLNAELTKLYAGHEALPPEEQQQWATERARGFAGDAQVDAWNRLINIPNAKDDPVGFVKAMWDSRGDAKLLAEMQGGEDADPTQAERGEQSILAKKPIEQFMEEETARKVIDQQVAPLLEQAKTPENNPSMMAQIADGAKAFFSEPRNWLIPLGGLLMLFGGKTAKILGGLALAGGAADLYGRYQGIKSMGQDPEGQAVYKSAVTFKNAKGESQPFGNIKELITQYPKYAQALNDTNTLFAMGLRNQFDKQVLTTALQRMQAAGFSIDASLNLLVERKHIDKERADDMRKDFAQQAQDAAKRQAETQAAAQAQTSGT